MKMNKWPHRDKDKANASNTEEKQEILEITSKGVARVSYNSNSSFPISVTKIDWPDRFHDYIVGEIMSGVIFYNIVDRGGINNFDGMIGQVYIDGYRSNLGLTHKGLSQGEFLVDGETWLKLCKDYDIMVEWCNK